MTALLITYLIITVLAGAIADGLNDSGKKKIGHLLEALELLLALSGAFIFELNYWVYIVGYIGLRIAFFDIAYNVTRGLPVFHTGTSNYWDSFLSKFPPFGIVFARLIFLALAIGVVIKYC